MGLESATYINQLVTAWPLGTDQIRYGAHHLRLIKLSLQNTFPDIDGAVVLTKEELNQFQGFDVNAINAVTLAGQLPAFYRDAANLNAGVLADARVQESNVTQHEEALHIAATQVIPSYVDEDGSVAFTVGAEHREQIRRFTGACTITLPNTIPAGWEIGNVFGAIRAAGATVTFQCPGGTIRSSNGLSILGNNGKAFALLASAGTWELGGNV